MSTDPVLRARICAVISSFLLVTACTHTVKPHRPEVSKLPPANVTLPPKLPDKASTPTSRPIVKPAESVLLVTLTGDLVSLQDAIRAAVPEVFDEQRHPLGADFRWTFKRQGEPQIALENGQLDIHAEYRGDIEARSTTGRACRLDPIYPVLDWNARLSTRQEGEDLIIRPDAPALSIGLKPESNETCNMFAIPLKEQLAELLNHTQVEEQISRAIADARLTIPTHPLWEQLHGPYVAPITSLNTRVCIYPYPSEISIGPLEGTLRQTVLLRGTAKVDALAVLEQSCEKPRIEPAKIITGAPSSSLGQSFFLTAMLPVPYPVLSQRLQQKLFHNEVSLSDEGMFGEKRITIERVSAAEAGGKLLIMVETTGYLNGPIYFAGSPQLEGTVVTVPDLQMDLETKRLLDAEKVGLWKRVDTALSDRVRRAIRIDLADDIANVKNAIGGPHKTADFVLELGVGRLRPQRVYATAEGLITDLTIEGTAQAEGRMKVASTPSMPQRKEPAIAAPSESRPQIVRGEILQVESTAYVIRDASGREVRLLVDQNTRMESMPKPGEKIVAEIAEDGRTRSISHAPSSFPRTEPIPGSPAR